MEAYLDNAATTRPCAAAVEEATRLMTQCWGNPSSGHHTGVLAAQAMKQARTRVSAALGAPADRVFFTSGGTEADNWAIFSAMRRMGKRGGHIITTAVEHHAVLAPMEVLAGQGYTVTYLQPDSLGRISLEAFAAALRPDTVLASVMLVNNESGAVMPVEQLAAALHENRPDAIFHTDAVQGLGKVPCKVRALGVDLMSVSAHKIHGLKGAGALYIRAGLELPPFLYGGGQESGKRSGTEALPAIGAFGAACAQLDPARDIPRMAALRDRARDEIACRIPALRLLGAMDAPHILTLSLPGVRSQSLMNVLQDQGVSVSMGSACSKGHRSHVLTAMGLDSKLVDGAVRVSLCRDTTEAEMDLLVCALETAAARLQERRPVQ